MKFHISFWSFNLQFNTLFCFNLFRYIQTLLKLHMWRCHISPAENKNRMLYLQPENSQEGIILNIKNIILSLTTTLPIKQNYSRIKKGWEWHVWFLLPCNNHYLPLCLNKSSWGGRRVRNRCPKHRSKLSILSTKTNIT